MHNALCVPVELAYNFEAKANLLYFSRKFHTKHIQIRNTSAIPCQTLCKPQNTVINSFISLICNKITY